MIFNCRPPCRGATEGVAVHQIHAGKRQNISEVNHSELDETVSDFSGNLGRGSALIFID